MRKSPLRVVCMMALALFTSRSPFFSRKFSFSEVQSEGCRFGSWLHQGSIRRNQGPIEEEHKTIGFRVPIKSIRSIRSRVLIGTLSPINHTKAGRHHSEKPFLQLNQGPANERKYAIITQSASKNTSSESNEHSTVSSQSTTG
jgi:hypothetical protein